MLFGLRKYNFHVSKTQNHGYHAAKLAKIKLEKKLVCMRKTIFDLWQYFDLLAHYATLRNKDII